jgi:hypothetical protein
MIIHMEFQRMPFGVFKLSGGRFDSGVGLPVDVLKELQNYKALILSVASSIYKKENPEKKRLPARFVDDFDLRIQDVRTGCVITDLNYPVAFKQGLLTEDNNYYTRARKILADATNSLKENKSADVLKEIPQEALKRYFSMGESLSESEVLHFGETQGEQAVIDGEWRSIIDELYPYDREEVVLQGRIISLSSDRSGKTAKYKFLETIDDTIYSGTVPEGEFDRFRQLLGEGRRAPLVSLSTIVSRKERWGKKYIEETYNAEAALPKRLREKIRSLEELKEGWFQPPETPGLPIEKASLNELEFLVQASIEMEYGDPLITPTPKGGVQLEWENNDFEIEIAPEGWVMAFNLSDDRDDDGEQSFSESTDPQTIFSWLRGDIEL